MCGIVIWRLDWGWGTYFQDGAPTWLLAGGLCCHYTALPRRCSQLLPEWEIQDIQDAAPCVTTSLRSDTINSTAFPIFLERSQVWPHWRGVWVETSPLEGRHVNKYEDVFESHHTSLGSKSMSNPPGHHSSMRQSALLIRLAWGQHLPSQPASPACSSSPSGIWFMFICMF